jgi:hypothetical protein
MFWGWFSFDNGGLRRGGGCIFLPFLFICGSSFLFSRGNATWLILLVLVAAAWFMFSNMQNGEKPKRDFEKPKREYLSRDDGEFIEVVDPTEDEGGNREDF